MVDSISWYAQGGQFEKTNVRMVGKIVIITGCNAGIGKEVAIDLARRGAKIYMACRDQKRAEEARQVIIRATGNSNVVFIPCDLASLSSVRSFAHDKLARILFSRALAKRLLTTGVTSNSLHPGIIRTVGAVRRYIPLMDVFIAPLFLFMKTARSGAQSTIALAVDPELEQVSAKYFSDCRIVNESESAKDDEMAEWLWEMYENMTGLNERV
ncbi:retinol dehydrogenase 12-like isoform X2 [Sitodiplosis mosellana]|uniref:retinol dehydrogenase 12-like isoform X2 n=1 Tax=Sitodiplosis mosellana TaxID=263140 RepID=UPI002444C733|nr:retinol dehydrogenase 12-like isoform X2 [Sitodiplosis mosellana]